MGRRLRGRLPVALLHALHPGAAGDTRPAGEDGFVIAALYKFVDLPDYRDWQPVLQALCEAGGVRGTLLLADEGINGTICARRDGMGRVLDWIEAEPRLDGLSLKFSAAPDQAFLRMKVRLKREIVTMG
ncbi:MAG: hypothetical protein ACPHE2_00005, partial [Candidatus Puniceispirillaceae bacterium]